MPLNPARRDTRKLLASPQDMHAAVLAAFPPDLAVRRKTSDDRVLWRVARDRPQHVLLLFVCSAAAPDLTHLAKQAGWPTTSGWETQDYSPLLDRLVPGQRAFRLTANPVRRLRDDKHPRRGAPRGHVTAAQQTAWLVSRTPSAGFTLATTSAGHSAVSVRDRRVVSFAR